MIFFLNEPVLFVAASNETDTSVHESVFRKRRPPCKRIPRQTADCFNQLMALINQSKFHQKTPLLDKRFVLGFVMYFNS